MTNLSREVRKRRRDAVNIPDEECELPVPGKGKRCEECTGSDSKTKYFCKMCYKYICLGHAIILCKNCKQKNSDDSNDSDHDDGDS